MLDEEVPIMPELHEIMSTVDTRLDRLEERRSKEITEKMEAWERLFNVIVDTKIATVSDLINKLQAEKDDQYNENKQKLEKYYDQLIELKTKLNEVALMQDSLRGDVNVVKGVTRETERYIRDQEAKSIRDVEWKTKVDIAIEESKNAITEIETTLKEIKEWRQTFWYKYIASGFILVLAAVEISEKIWDWVKAGLTG